MCLYMTEVLYSFKNLRALSQVFALLMFFGVILHTMLIIIIIIIV